MPTMAFLLAPNILFCDFWALTFLVTASGHLVMSDTLNVHFLADIPSKPGIPRYAVIDIAQENYIKDHPDSTIFTQHEVRYATATIILCSNLF